MATVTNLGIKPPVPFDLASTAYSHGWAVLFPNSWDAETQVLQRVQQLATGEVVMLEIFGKGPVNEAQINIKASSRLKLDDKSRSEIKAAVSKMLRLEEDLSEFHKLCRKKGGAWLQVTKGMGRLLASPTVFEDLVKTICTTNIQWVGPKRMVMGLAEALGAPYLRMGN